MRFSVLTLFPEMIEEMFSHSITGRAVKSGIIKLQTINIREFSKSKHRQVDDYPYGGGHGMILQPGPIYDAFKSLNLPKETKVIYMSPQGTPFNQEIAKKLSLEKELVLLCGHYEGIDERVIEEIVTDEISLGDFILTGGEIAAIAIIDAVSRLIPGVLGSYDSSLDESFSDGLLEYPQYTRPPEFMGRKVPEVLLSGNHKKIELWRKEQSLIRTEKKRPDLLKNNTALNQ